MADPGTHTGLAMRRLFPGQRRDTIIITTLHTRTFRSHSLCPCHGLEGAGKTGNFGVVVIVPDEVVGPKVRGCNVVMMWDQRCVERGDDDGVSWPGISLSVGAWVS